MLPQPHLHGVLEYRAARPGAPALAVNDAYAAPVAVPGLEQELTEGCARLGGT